MMNKLAFIFVAKGVSEETHTSVLKTDSMELTVVGLETYEEAAKVAKKLYENGCIGIELCAGFGHRGTAMIAEAVEGKIPVGVVRFDIHPALGNQSGDNFR